MTKSRTAWSIVLAAMIAASIIGVASAHGTPFGAPHPDAVSSASGLTGWIFAKQAEFYRSLSSLIRASKEDGAATWGLFAISFLYGVFHAVGPGHGKALISSYVVANKESWRRGVVLSFASGAFQSAVAIIVVAVAAALLGATAAAIGSTVHVIEIVSYGLVIAIGLRLLYVKGRAFLVACRVLTRRELMWREPAWRDTPAVVTAAGFGSERVVRTGQRTGWLAMPAGQCQFEACVDHAHGFHCEHDPDHHESAWSHAHGPTPAELAGAGGWQRGLSAVIAVGLRPCSGAIIVLVFALAQDLFWTGIGATLVMGLGTAMTVAAIATLAVSTRQLASRMARAQAGVGVLLMRAMEVGASVAIVIFGTLLLAGYMATEQLWMFTK